MGKKNVEKKDILKKEVKHIDMKSFDSTKIINSYNEMSFSSRETANAAKLYERMINDKKATIVLALAGSTSAAGCMDIYTDLVKHKMIDVIVATGASIVDMDFFEALGFKHYHGNPNADDHHLRNNYIDRIYDTYIDEEQLQVCDKTVKDIADTLTPGVYSSRKFILEMGKFLKRTPNRKVNSLVEVAFDNNVPIFCPAFSDSSAGLGLVLHQESRIKNSKPYVSIDSVADFRELTYIKMNAGSTGLFMIGGGVPKNFVQDTVICAEVLGKNVPMHKYAVQITVADVRDGACSSSTLKEAHSWGKVDNKNEQMVYAEATSVLPLIASYVYHNADWKRRERRNWRNLFK